MLYGTPSLRASHFEKQLRWQELLVPNIRMRLGEATGDVVDAHVVWVRSVRAAVS